VVCLFFFFFPGYVRTANAATELLAFGDSTYSQIVYPGAYVGTPQDLTNKLRGMAPSKAVGGGLASSFIVVLTSTIRHVAGGAQPGVRTLHFRYLFSVELL
jgi:hypothetical protein